ncbi:peptide chain release factor 1 [Candidatus Uhrbacteria bacterium]|nr:peptide chain release factor 1 [Candidatus Uhrbacteria bacterium]
MNLPKEINQKRERQAALEQELQKTEVISDPQKLKTITREYTELGAILETAGQWQSALSAIEEAKRIIRESQEADLRQLAEAELATLETQKAKLESELQTSLTPADPLDGKNIIMEIRAGTGGEEAALFAAELFRMYARLAERQGWRTALASLAKTDLNGIKEVIFEIAGTNVYRHLKFESGVHRVQRIPETEKSGRLHTSTVTVAVLPEAEEVDIAINPSDLKIETSTSRGHGGQSVNTTYSAIRLTHLPSGITVSCQDERSQQQNRARALQILRSRLFAAEQERLHTARAAARKAMIGGAERSEKIRTYNFPQDRLTDHRLKESWHNLPAIMDGDLLPIIEKLRQEEYR